MDYKVIAVSERYQTTAARELEKLVKVYLSKGWKPLGGVSVSRTDSLLFQKIVMSQAMIKE